MRGVGGPAAATPLSAGRWQQRLYFRLCRRAWVWRAGAGPVRCVASAEWRIEWRVLRRAGRRRGRSRGRERHVASSVASGLLGVWRVWRVAWAWARVLPRACRACGARGARVLPVPSAQSVTYQCGPCACALPVCCLCDDTPMCDMRWRWVGVPRPACVCLSSVPGHGQSWSMSMSLYMRRLCRLC